MKPLFDKILIQVEEAKAEELTSGIIIPGKEEEKLEKATIVEVGSDCVSELKKGDEIVFKSYSADIITLEKVEYSFIREEDILAICTSTTTK